MPNKEGLLKLIQENERRLQKRNEQKARFGINAPPEIVTEIEDIEIEIERLYKALGENTDLETLNPAPRTDTSRRNQMTKRKVTVNIEGSENVKLSTAGKDIVDYAQPNYTPSSEGSDVEVSVKNVHGATIATAGGSLIDFEQVSEPLQELKLLISENLRQKDAVEDLQEIIISLENQAQKPLEARSISKIKRLLENVGTYLGLASLVATQAEKAEQLFETVKGLLLGR